MQKSEVLEEEKCNMSNGAEENAAEDPGNEAADDDVEPKQKTANGKRKYTWRPTICMSKDMSIAFCVKAKCPCPKSGHKKCHVEGALNRLQWSFEKFLRVYNAFRVLFAGREEELCDWYVKNQVYGKVWIKVSALKKNGRHGGGGLALASLTYQQCVTICQ